MAATEALEIQMIVRVSVYMTFMVYMNYMNCMTFMVYMDYMTFMEVMIYMTFMVFMVYFKHDFISLNSDVHGLHGLLKSQPLGLQDLLVLITF